jgi:FSR family fosmidomycin resistance protein-like MFS transporter
VKLRFLLCLALLHTLVDGYAQVVTPLWPQLTKGLGPRTFTVVLASWQLATSLSQPLFACWGDRFGSRWLVGFGPALAVVCVSLLGFASGPVSLMCLLVLGGLGIGAFHPEAAVGVVEAAGTRMTQGLAIFVCGGMVGLGLGPLVSGTLAAEYGLPSLVWLMPPGLVLVGLLFLVHGPAAHAFPHGLQGDGLIDALRGRWGAALLLLTVATLRVVPILGIPLTLAFWLDQQDVSEAGIGLHQSLFLLSGGLGTLLCPLLFRPGREVAGLVGTMLPAAGCVALLTQRHAVAYYTGLIGAGFLLQGSIPLLIAHSQRVLPRGQRLAASLTLGTSWGLGGLVVAGLQAYFNAAGRFEGLLWALVPFTVLAALGSCLLPRSGTAPDVVAPAPTLSPSPIAPR